MYRALPVSENPPAVKQVPERPAQRAEGVVPLSHPLLVNRVGGESEWQSRNLDIARGLIQVN